MFGIKSNKQPVEEPVSEEPKPDDTLWLVASQDELDYVFKSGLICGPTLVGKIEDARNLCKKEANKDRTKAYVFRCDPVFQVTPIDAEPELCKK